MPRRIVPRPGGKGDEVVGKLKATPSPQTAESQPD